MHDFEQKMRMHLHKEVRDFEQVQKTRNMISTEKVQLKLKKV
jgi:hypothetical protein